MNLYTRELFFQDRFGVIFDYGTPGDRRFTVRGERGDVLWRSPDDSFGTVAFMALSKLSSKHPESISFPSLGLSGSGAAVRLHDLYLAFKRKTFERAVKPWLDNNNVAAAANYDRMVELVKDVPEPAECPRNELWK